LLPGTPSFVYNVYRLSSWGVNRAGLSVGYFPTSSAKFTKRVELHHNPNLSTFFVSYCGVTLTFAF